jgi:2-desacetyl-2-hydroxyethyl bacteriochlorophyllide A dehydrogenase
MKGVCFQAVQKIALLDMDQPKIESPRDVIVQVSMAGLCGSDLHPYFGREAGLDPGTVMGHEFVGTIVDVGSEVNDFAHGDRVFVPFSSNCGNCYYCGIGLTSRCVEGQLYGWRQNSSGLHGGQSEFVRVPLADGSLMKVSSGVSDIAALLLGDNFSTGFYCAEMAEVKPGGAYAVVGCGTVGQLGIVAALSMGAEKVFAFDLVAERRQQAERLGAIPMEPNDSGVAAVMTATGGRGADGVMELVGLPAAQELAYRLMRPGGVMSVIGCHCTSNFAFSPVDAYDKNLTYKTGRCPARHYMGLLTQRVADGEFDLDGFVTHRFGIDECKKAYEVFSGQLDGCTKAVLEF